MNTPSRAHAAPQPQPQRIAIDSTTIFTAGLVVLFLVVSVAPKEIAAVIGAIAFAGLAFRKGIAWRGAMTLLPTFAITVVGIAGTAFWGVAEPIIALRSAFYAGFTIVFLLLGLALSGSLPNTRILFRAICLAGLIASIAFIYAYVTTDIGPAASRFDMRTQIGQGYLIAAIALASLVTQRTTLGWDWPAILLVSAICLVEIILSDSRTSMVLFLLIVIVSFFHSTAMRVSKPGLMGLGLILFAITTPILAFAFGDAGSLLLRSLAWSQELIPTEYMRAKDINSNWRGFETARAFDFVSSHGAFATAFGIGWGQAVPLDITLVLGNERTNAAGTLHNLYANVFLRAGFLGIGLYLWQIWLLAGASMWTGLREPLLNRLALGMLLAAILVAPVIAGLYATGAAGAFFAMFAGIVAGKAAVAKSEAMHALSSVATKQGGIRSPEDHSRRAI